MKMQFHLGHKYNKHHNHGNRTLDIDQLAVTSGLAHVNSELKMIVGIGSLIICLMSKKGITAIIVAIAMAYVTLHYGKIKKYNYWHMIMIPFSFIVLSGIVLLVDISKYKMGYIDIPVFSRYLVVTQESLRSAVSVSVKAVSGIICLYMISLSTPVYEMIGVLKKCRIPEIIIELMYLIYRFIFILLEAYHNMKTAADTRLGYINLRRAYQSFFGVCSNLFVVAFKKASRSFDAMEARCYDGKLQFLEKNKPVTTRQTLIAGVYLFAMIIVLMLERIGI